MDYYKSYDDYTAEDVCLAHGMVRIILQKKRELIPACLSCESPEERRLLLSLTS